MGKSEHKETHSTPETPNPNRENSDKIGSPPKKEPKMVGDPLSAWGWAFRRVELFFKKYIAYGQCLCPLDSRMWGSAPWPCICCAEIRRRLRGQRFPKNAIVTGGKKHNRRGRPLTWFMPTKLPKNTMYMTKDGEMMHIKRGWIQPAIHKMVMTAYCIMKRHQLQRLVGAGVQFSPFFVTGLGAFGILVQSPITQRITLRVIYSPRLKVEPRDEHALFFYQDPQRLPFSPSYVQRRIRTAHSVLQRLQESEAVPSTVD